MTEQEAITEFRVRTELALSKLKSDLDGIAEKSRDAGQEFKAEITRIRADLDTAQAELEAGVNKLEKRIDNRLDNVTGSIGDLAALTASNLGKLETAIDGLKGLDPERMEATLDRVESLDMEGLRTVLRIVDHIDRIAHTFTSVLGGAPKYRWIFVLIVLILAIFFGHNVLKLLSI